MKVQRVTGWIVEVETHFEYAGDPDTRYYYTYTTDEPIPANDEMYEEWKEGVVEEILADIAPTQEIVDRIYIKNADECHYFETELFVRE